MLSFFIGGYSSQGEEALFGERAPVWPLKFGFYSEGVKYWPGEHFLGREEY